jgi:hypothetical protein
VDKVEDYVTTRADVEPTLKSFQEMIAKYQFMEVNQQKRATGLKEKMPDIQKTLDTVRFLKSRKVRRNLGCVSNHHADTLSPAGRRPNRGILRVE